MNSPRRWTAGTLVYSSAGLAALFLWLLLGDFVWSMRERSVGPMAQWYLDHLKVTNLLFGLLISTLPTLIGVVLGPIVSVKSDRHRGKWGRRIPFLLVTTPVAAFGMIGLALTPMLAGWLRSVFPQAGPGVLELITFAMFWITYEIASGVSQSVFGGLINDVVPKELLGRFFGLFRAVSLIDGIVFNYYIMGKVPDHYSLILLVVGIFYGAAFFVVCLKVREGSYPPPPAKIGAGRFFGVRQYLRESFSNPYYLCVYGMLTMALLALTSAGIFAIPYARSMGVTMESYGKAVALTYMISLVLVWFVGWMADRFHPLRMVIASLGAYFLLTIAGWFFATSAGGFLAVCVAQGVVSGFYWTSSASLGQRLFPREKFAQFASAAVIVNAPFTMSIAPIVGLWIDGTGNFYRLTYAISGALTIAAIGFGFLVHRRFMQLGGPEAYAAPE